MSAIEFYSSGSARNNPNGIHELIDEPCASQGRNVVVLIDSRRLERECFIRIIEMLNSTTTIMGYASASEYFHARSRLRFQPDTVILSIGKSRISEEPIANELQMLHGTPKHAPFVVLADSEDLEDMVVALEFGASGYVPSSIGIESIIDAARLAARGGIFLPAESLKKLRGSVSSRMTLNPDFEQFTGRQTAVANALRRGKANKTIAYQLNMCESTVKVHVRNIMRKLNATNRTEAAYRLNVIAQEVEDVREETLKSASTA